MALLPTFQEIAPRRPAVWSGYCAGDDAPAQFLRAAGAAYRGRAGLYQLFNEMEDKDGHLFSVLQTRKNGVLARPRSIEPSAQDARSRDVARFIEDALAAIPNFDAALLQLLDALGKGMAIAEVMWARRDGALVVDSIRSRFQGRFAFDDHGRLCLMDAPAASSSGGGREGAAVPPRKFLLLTFNARHDNPYGQGLCEKAYWYYWFKKNNLKFWVAYNERFGSPTVIARFRPGTTPAEQDRLLEVIDSIRHDAGVAIPDSVAIELLEARRQGSAGTYQQLADWCNDEISKIVLGQTLTASEGRRSGSLALARVHDAVRNEYVESDARALMAVINGQLIRWLVDFNFGPAVAAPRWIIDTSKDEDLAEQSAVDRQLVSMGVPLSAEYFYRRYGRPAPEPGERALSYDDRNLYQYHLQYGVLTINEVRRALGLPPVAWGEQPTRPTRESPAGPNETRATPPLEDAERDIEKEIEQSGA